MINLKKIKKKRIKDKPVIIEQNNQLKTLTITIIIIIVLLIPVYFITTLVLNNRDNEVTNNNPDVLIQKEKILVGQLFNRPETNYYVLAYKEDDKFLDLFDKYLDDYKSSENSLTFYKIDLEEGFNKQYIDNETKISDDLNELKLSTTTLFKIKDGKIESYYVGNNDILNYLKEING